MLRASAQLAKEDVDLNLITGEASDNGGIDHGKSLVGFAEALVSRDEAALEKARSTLRNEMSPEAMVDASAIVGNFQRMVRIADATGIPLDTPMRIMAKDIQRELGLGRFASAENTPAPSLLVRLLGPVMKIIISLMLRRMGKK